LQRSLRRCRCATLPRALAHEPHTVPDILARLAVASVFALNNAMPWDAHMYVIDTPSMHQRSAV
jgi:hypothetical protein